MAVKFCKQCGSEMAAGKRFCGRCGAAITEATGFVGPVVESVKESSPSASLDPSTPSPPVDVPVQLSLNDQPPNAVIPIEHPIEESDNSADRRPDKMHDEYATSMRTDEPAGINPDAPAPQNAPLIAPPTKGRPSPRLLVATGLVVVTLAACAVGLIEWHKKSTGVAAVSPAQPKSLTDTRAPSTNPELVAKLDGDGPSPVPMPRSLAPEVKRKVAPSPTPQREASVKSPTADNNVDRSGASTPVLGERAASAPIIRVAPATATAGVLHYAGPPIHHGEVITFSGLPGAMLRFTFDHSSWQPRILHQSDGTQTLLLRSVIQNDQIGCEVRWEVAK